LKELTLLHEAPVAENEIDDLGHMNVRYYGERALDSTHELLSNHGLSPDSCESVGAVLDVFDIYTRHHREQLAGAPLAVRGGVLDAGDDGVRLYHELTNTDSGELAATFVHRIQLRDLESRSAVVLPADVRKSLGESIVGWPEHGQSRTIDLDRTAPPLTLAEARRRGLAIRKERRVRADECDANGFAPPSRRLELVWGGEPLHPGANGPPMFDLDDGGRMSLAALETRSLLFESPKVGTLIQSFSAIVEIARKTIVRRTWVFDVERARLLHNNMMVDIALHLGERRSLEIPANVRSTFEAEAQLDLRSSRQNPGDD
jgi:acyl-CoA thioester hydrolase